MQRPRFLYQDGRGTFALLAPAGHRSSWLSCRFHFQGDQLWSILRLSNSPTPRFAPASGISQSHPCLYQWSACRSYWARGRAWPSLPMPAWWRCASMETHLRWHRRSQGHHLTSAAHCWLRLRNLRVLESPWGWPDAIVLQSRCCLLSCAWPWGHTKAIWMKLSWWSFSAAHPLESLGIAIGLLASDWWFDWSWWENHSTWSCHGLHVPKCRYFSHDQDTIATLAPYRARSGPSLPPVVVVLQLIVLARPSGACFRDLWLPFALQYYRIELIWWILLSVFAFIFIFRYHRSELM